MKQLPQGSVTTPAGFRAASAACGLKASGKPDLALLVSSNACSAAGLFTRNRVVAAPVVLDRETLAANPAGMRGVVANAGIANACTGEAGYQAARVMQARAAQAFGCQPQQVLVLSTGVIGVQLDLDKIDSGIRQAAARLRPDGGPDLARAIMTTDTRPKHLALEASLPGGVVTLGGVAKGAGMIHPNMATMLAVLTSDVSAPPALLQDLLTQAVEASFNRISIDGDTSTNDTVLLLANGASGVALDSPAARQAFSEALQTLCVHLAQAIVRDGEGARKFIHVQISGAATEEQALRVAQTIATSPLVKTAFAGGDPNWGRILAAAGRSGVELQPERLALTIGKGAKADLALVAGGAPLAFEEHQAAAIFAQSEFSLLLDLGQGTAETTVWTCDLTHEYVTINADYRT